MNDDESLSLFFFLKVSDMKQEVKIAANQQEADLTSSDLSKGTDSMKVSYILLFFALFFTMSLRNVARSWIKTNQKIIINKEVTQHLPLRGTGYSWC